MTTPLILLHSDPELRSRLGRLPGQEYAVTPVADWNELRAALRRVAPDAVCVVHPLAADGAPATALHDLLRECRSATVLAAFAVTVESHEALRTLLSWGVADVADLLREDTPQALARRLALVRKQAVQRLLARALPRGVPSRTRALLSVAADVVAAGGQAPQFAEALGVDERTVPRWCARADLPPPRRLLAWLRLLRAAALLDDPERPLETVARGAGYAGAASLKTALRNFLDASPGELRREGALDRAADAFSRDLFTLRERARSAGRPHALWLH